MPAHVRVSGVWRKTLASVRVAGAWRSVPQIYVKIGGAWRALYSYAWSLGGWGDCSASCGGGTQTRSVTCARNDGVTVDDAVCLKLVGAKPATSQACNTQTCISCKYDAVFYPHCHGLLTNSITSNTYIWMANFDNDQETRGMLYVGGNLITRSLPVGSTTYDSYWRGELKDTCIHRWNINSRDSSYGYAVCGPL